MKPLRITLVRHGESIGNVDRSVYDTTPDWRVPLTETGREQARALGRVLRERIKSPLGVYTSSYRRAVETTSEILSQLPAPRFVREDPRLREQEWSGGPKAEGRTFADVEEERDAYGTFFYRFKHGESGADCYDRCATFLHDLDRDFARPTFPAEALIVSHAFTLRILVMRWLNLSVDEFHAMRKPGNAQAFELLLGADEHYHLATPWPTR